MTLKGTQGFQKFVDAIAQILDDQPVEDLDAIIDGMTKDGEADVLEFMDLGQGIPAARGENRVLQGEHPQEVYGGMRYSLNARKFLRRFLHKYQE